MSPASFFVGRTPSVDLPATTNPPPPPSTQPAAPQLAGGNLQSDQMTAPWDQPPQTSQPIGLWCGHPVPAPDLPLLPSIPASAAISRPTSLFPVASAPDTSAAVPQPRPFATAPVAAPSPSYPNPTPLRFLSPYNASTANSTQHRCGFHLGFGLVVRQFVQRAVPAWIATCELVSIALQSRPVVVAGFPWSGTDGIQWVAGCCSRTVTPCMAMYRLAGRVGLIRRESGAESLRARGVRVESRLPTRRVRISGTTMPGRR